MASRGTRFCAGLPFDGERPLTAEERARLAVRRRAWGARALARVAFVPAVLAVGSAVVAGAAGAGAELLAATGAVVFGLVTPIAALVHAWGAATTWLLLGRDARDGRALRFAGGGRSVAILPHSGFALEWDGVPAAVERRLHVGEAAEVPAGAATYAVDVSTARVAPGLDLVRRPLSPAEREEILCHAARLGRVPLVLGGFSAAFVLLAAQVLGAGDAGAAEAALVLVWAAVLAYGWSRFLRARAMSRKLREDASNGWALRATAGAPAGNEVLAISGATWTVHGGPAPWRTFRGSLRR